MTAQVVCTKEVNAIHKETPTARNALPIIRRQGITWRGGVSGVPFELELIFENPTDEITRATVSA